MIGLVYVSLGLVIGWGVLELARGAGIVWAAKGELGLVVGVGLLRLVGGVAVASELGFGVDERPLDRSHEGLDIF